MKEILEKIAYHLHKNEIPKAKELAKDYYKEPPKYEIGTFGEFWDAAKPNQKIKGCLKDIQQLCSYPFVTYEIGTYQYFKPMPKPLDIGDRVRIDRDCMDLRKGDLVEIFEKKWAGDWTVKSERGLHQNVPESAMERI